MDPDYERRLRDEVIYLHSLWHQGPPRPPHQPTPSCLLHHPSNPTQFKKKERIKPRNKKGPKPKKNQPEDAQNPIQPPSSASGNEWPCNPTSNSPSATTSDWPTTWRQPNLQTLLHSSAEKGKLAASQAQFKALQRTREFFQSDDGDSEDDDDDDDLMEEEQYRFFVEMFMEDSELRKYYENNYYNGEFSCLVCGGMGKKFAGKKFKDCVALVQHSISIAKTKKRRAHRAHGQAVCKVLGWDIARLPNIVSELSEKRELSLTNPGQGEVEDGGKSEAQARVGEGSKDGLLALASKEDSINVRNSDRGNGESEGECEGPLQENVGEGNRDASTCLESKEGFMDVDDSGQGEFGGKGKGKANVGEGSKDDSLNVSNSGQCEENVGVGTMDASNTLESKEGTMEADDSGQGEAGGGGEGEVMGKANAAEVTDNDLTYLENKKLYWTLVSDGGRTSNKENSLTVAEASKSPEDFSKAAPEIVENKEAGLLNDGEPPKAKCIVGEN